MTPDEFLMWMWGGVAVALGIGIVAVVGIVFWALAEAVWWAGVTASGWLRRLLPRRRV